ncbi:glycosyltransferase family 2 protein [Gemmatimonas sp. UBA7669]|uniref:glycosyltransferase family 2 protein n=1 Tax=Gemmatimonas sp. UBA7669 TaxID=1946568 RepID=UPI0039C86337
MILSIVICTWNRVALLEQTLRSLKASTFRAGDSVEVLVINNASTDSTPEFLRDNASALGFRWLTEDRPGLSNARNRGAVEASGEWVLYLDDDVLVEPHFVEGYIAVLSDPGPSVYFGGPVIPRFLGPERTWTSHVFEVLPWLYSGLDLGEPRRFFSGNQHPFGANMCIRADLVQQFPFDEMYGYREGALTPGEESSLFSQLTAQTFRGEWLPSLGVVHVLPAARNSLRFLVRRSFAQGVYEGMAAFEASRSRLWAVRALALQFVRIPLAPLIGTHPIVELLKASVFAGVLLSRR